MAQLCESSTPNIFPIWLRSFMNISLKDILCFLSPPVHLNSTTLKLPSAYFTIRTFHIQYHKFFYSCTQFSSGFLKPPLCVLYTYLSVRIHFDWKTYIWENEMETERHWKWKCLPIFSRFEYMSALFCILVLKDFETLYVKEDAYMYVWEYIRMIPSVVTTFSCGVESFFCYFFFKYYVKFDWVFMEFSAWNNILDFIGYIWREFHIKANFILASIIRFMLFIALLPPFPN